MINDKKAFFPLFTSRNICCGYLLESPHWGDSNKYPQHTFLGILNTVFLNISNYLSHLELRNRCIQIAVITNFVVISNVGIKRFDCNYLSNKFTVFSSTNTIFWLLEDVESLIAWFIRSNHKKMFLSVFS